MISHDTSSECVKNVVETNHRHIMQQEHCPSQRKHPPHYYKPVIHTHRYSLTHRTNQSRYRLDKIYSKHGTSYKIKLYVWDSIIIINKNNNNTFVYRHRYSLTHRTTLQFSVATTLTAAVASLAVRCKNLTIASGNHGFPWGLS